MKHRWLGPWRASFDSCANALPKEHGGLGHGDDQRYYTNMLDMLCHLAFRYAVSLAYLSRSLAVGEELPIASMMQRIEAVIVSVTPRT